MEKVAEDLIGELLVAAVRFAGDDDDFSSGLDVAVSIANSVLVELGCRPPGRMRPKKIRTPIRRSGARLAFSVTLTAGEDVFLYFGTFLAPAVNVSHWISKEQRHSVTFSAGAVVFF